MPELRLNLIVREWVILSREKAKRPGDFRLTRNKKPLAEHLASCPFCPGNEHMTPDEIMRTTENGKWLVRVIPNKYAALSGEGERTRRNEGLKQLVAGVGRHEVIIETPFHNTPTALLPAVDIEKILSIYRDRFLAIHENQLVRHVIIFKNQGERSGTTILHPHSQIIGVPVTPFQVRERITEARRYFDHAGECLMCASLKDEITDGRRVLNNTDHFVTFIPYAALSPFHTWIFPKRHSGSFGDIRDDEICDCAYHLKTILSKLYLGLENPDFNFLIRSESIREKESEHFHWYMSIVPRITHVSGFELGSGMYINQSIPEEIAEFLRKVKVTNT